MFNPLVGKSVAVGLFVMFQEGRWVCIASSFWWLVHTAYEHPSPSISMGRSGDDKRGWNPSNTVWLL